MANEIRLNVSLTVAKGYLSLARTGTKTIDMSGTAYAAGGQSIGFAAHEAIGIGDVSTAGVGFFLNADATNYVEIGRDVSGTFYPVIKLKPGESAACRLATAAVYAKANTGAVVLDYLIISD